MSTSNAVSPKPALVRLADAAPLPAPDPSDKSVLRRLITKARCGAGLMLGHSTIPPGQETPWWSSRDVDDTSEGETWYGPVEETYFCISGRFTLVWDSGEIEFGPMDAVYLAPGWRYKLINSGKENGQLVYSMYPAKE